jgi:hypothetical protein
LEWKLLTSLEGHPIFQCEGMYAKNHLQMEGLFRRKINSCCSLALLKTESEKPKIAKRQ